MAARRREDAELALLSALCRGAHRALRQQVRQRLGGYRFTTGERQVLFEVLLALPQLRHEERAAQILAALTRLGFPDVALEAYFAPPPTAAEDALAVLETFAPPARP